MRGGIGTCRSNLFRVPPGTTWGKPGTTILLTPGPALTSSRNAPACHTPAAGPPVVSQWNVSCQGSGPFGYTPAPTVMKVSGDGGTPMLSRMHTGAVSVGKSGFAWILKAIGSPRLTNVNGNEVLIFPAPSHFRHGWPIHPSSWIGLVGLV